MESENTAGAEAAEEQAAPGIESLGELLQESEPVEPGDEEGAGASGEESGSENSTPSKFNDLAGKLDMELDALYKLEISQAADGTPVTIEDLKDRFTKHDDLSMREIEFEERRTTQESEILQAQEELRELMASLPPKAISPEVLNKVRAKAEAQRTLEQQRTLELIPSWQDQDTRTADLTGMAEHLKQYGYPVDHLQRVADARQIKYIRDNWQREQRIRKALEAVKAGKPNPTKPSKPTGKAPSKQTLAGVNRGNHGSKLEAIFSNVD